MGTRCLLGIVFTPSWLRVVHIKLSRRQVLSCAQHKEPLPVGCINEDTGAIEDFQALKAVMREMPCIESQSYGIGGVFMVVPQLLCYRSTAAVPVALRDAPVDRILAECISEVPGDREALIVSAHAHDCSKSSQRSIMVVAARRDAIEAYARLFTERLWSVGGITTGEVARFNRWIMQRPDTRDETVVVCSADVDSREVSVWDRGVLIESDARYTRRGSRMTARTQEAHGNAPADDVAAASRAIIDTIQRQEKCGRRVSRVLCGGDLCAQFDLHSAVSQTSGVVCEASSGRSCLGVFAMASKSALDNLSIAPERQIFDDALGAVIPKLVVQTGW